MATKKPRPTPLQLYTTQTNRYESEDAWHQYKTNQNKMEHDTCKAIWRKMYVHEPKPAAHQRAESRLKDLNNFLNTKIPIPSQFSDLLRKYVKSHHTCGNTVRFFLPIMTFFYANNDIYNDTNNDINNDICIIWSIMIFECHYWIFCDQ